MSKENLRLEGEAERDGEEWLDLPSFPLANSICLFGFPEKSLKLALTLDLIYIFPFWCYEYTQVVICWRGSKSHRAMQGLWGILAYLLVRVLGETPEW